MRAAAAFALAALVGACWQPPRAPDGTVAIAGALWTTPAKPWRFPGALSQLVPDGETALALMSGRQIVRVDLRAGRILAAHAHPTFALAELRHLHDGRWLVTGTIAGAFAAALVEPTTLALTMLPIHGHPNANTLRTITGQLADGRVVLAGPGLPFAAYDPHTWLAGPTISDLGGYAAVVIERDSVLVMHLGKVVRYTPSGGLGADLESVGNIPIAAASGVLASRIYKRPGFAAKVETPDGKSLDLPAPVEQLALSADGARVATLGAGILSVVRVADGAELRRVDLGDMGRMTPASLVVEATRVIVTVGAGLRVVELATGGVTPDGGPPYGGVRAVAVSNEGRITALGSHAWTFDPDGGAVRVGAPLAGVTIVPPPLGEVGRYVTLAKGEPSTLELRDVTTGELTHRTTLEADASDAYIGPAGELVVAEASTPASLWHTTRGPLTRALWLAEVATVDDADPVTGLALLAVGGIVSVVRLRDAQVTLSLPVPGCDPYGSALLERGGRRAFTQSDDDLFVWDRTTGDEVASLHEPASPYSPDPVFVPDHDEILVTHGPELQLWSLVDNTARTVQVGSMFWSALSPDGKRAALVMMDGRTALLDLDVVRTAVPAHPVLPAHEPPSCGTGDPIGVPPPEPEPAESSNDGWDGAP